MAEGRMTMKKVLITTVLVFAVFVVSIPDMSAQTINGCVNTRSGALRISSTCAKGETPISWNQQGPTGATGATGPAGPTGATGPAGPAGSVPQETLDFICQLASGLYIQLATGLYIACPTFCDCSRFVKKVFITHDTYTGDLGGLSGADEICQELATGAGLIGTFKAWLSDASGSPAQRFVKSHYPYVDTMGRVVANDWNDLITGQLRSQIENDPIGRPIVGQVWTNTNIDGTPVPTTQDQTACTNWTSAATNIWGRQGRSSRMDSGWTDVGSNERCINEAHLYCFQQ